MGVEDSNSGPAGPDVITLYSHPCSPPGIALQMVCDLVKLPYNKIDVDLFGGEHFTPEFLQKNPWGKVPTLHDKDFMLAESRAILTYLVEKFGGENNALYPKGSLTDRSRIDAMLYYDIGTLYPAIKEYVYPQIFYHISKPLSPPDPVKRGKLDDAVTLLNAEVKRNPSGFLVTDRVTVADVSVYCSLHMANMVDYDVSQYSHLAQWMAAMRETFPKYGEYFAGLLEYKEKVKDM